MTVDLTMLIWSAALALAHCVIAVLGAILQLGLPAVVGNRASTAALDGWAGRAQRAHRNILESLVLFAVLVLTAQVAGRANAATALGAQLFFWARVAYAPVYLIGISWLRTAIWAVSIAGLAIIFAQLL